MNENRIGLPNRVVAWMFPSTSLIEVEAEPRAVAEGRFEEGGLGQGIVEQLRVEADRDGPAPVDLHAVSGPPGA